MEIIRVVLYELSELSPKAQSKAADFYRDINIDYDWWQDIYEYFTELANTIGVSIPGGRVYFNGFYSQGSGSAFDCTVDLLQMVSGVAQQSWKAVTQDDLSVPPIVLDKRVEKLIEKQKITADIKTRPSRSDNYLVETIEFGYSTGKCHAYPNIENALEATRHSVSAILTLLNKYLFRALEREYDYRVGAPAVHESIIANCYVFTIDGNAADNLKQLANEAPL